MASSPVFMFLAQAKAGDAQDHHPAGEVHMVLVFVKQGADDAQAPNWKMCEAVLKTCGWELIEFKGAQPATPEAIQAIQKRPEPAIEQAARDALRKGFGVLVFGA